MLCVTGWSSDWTESSILWKNDRPTSAFLSSWLFNAYLEMKVYCYMYHITCCTVQLQTDDILLCIQKSIILFCTVSEITFCLIKCFISSTDLYICSMSSRCLTNFYKIPVLLLYCSLHVIWIYIKNSHRLCIWLLNHLDNRT